MPHAFPSMTTVAVTALAGFAAAKAVAIEAVARPTMNRVLERLTVPDAHSDDWPEAVVAKADRLLYVDLEAGEVDLREIHRGGWTVSHGWRKWVADMTTCPKCLSWWTTIGALAVMGRFRPWRPADWVTGFAAWGIAVQMAALPHNASSADGPNDYLNRAFHLIHQADDPTHTPGEAPA